MADYKFPQLTNSRQFEHLTLDCYKNRYPNANVYMNGRPGQKQGGIDVFVDFIKTGNVVTWGIQCKNYSTFSSSDVNAAIEECIYRPLDKLIIATAAPEDTKITAHVKKINDGKNVPFSVEFLSWEEICGYIQQFPIIYNRYYGQLKCQDEFRKIFADIIKSYSIEAFLRADPMTHVIYINIPCNIDLCCLELSYLLDQNTERRTEMLYEKIYRFNNCLDSYNGYLSVIMFPESYGENLCCFKYKRPDTYSELKKHEDDVYQYIVELTQLIDEIMRMS